MIVNQTDTGEYEVAAQDGTNRRLAGPFSSHAAAWRWIDRQTGAVSKAEERGEWRFEQSAAYTRSRDNG